MSADQQARPGAGAQRAQPPERVGDFGRAAAYRWPAEGAPGKPALVIVHGFAEHARRHAELATAASAAGHEVWALDLPGHGESPGPRAVVDGYRESLEAVSALVGRASREPAAVAPVLFGHSMGGAIALRIALAEPARLFGLVLSSPFLLDAEPRPAWLLQAGRVLARLAPRLVVAKLDADAISRDPTEVARYRHDPLNHTAGVPAVSGMTITTEGAHALSRASRLEVPTLLMHGSADRIASVEGSRRLAREAPRGLVEYVELEGGYHELFHDDQASGVPATVISETLRFLASRR